MKTFSWVGAGQNRPMDMLRLAVVALAFLVLPTSHAEEPDDSRILNQILGSRNAILHHSPADGVSTSNVFLAFWDFDGTILKGDSSEGLKDGAKTIYRGLAQLAIEHGYSSIYAPAGGFTRFWMDYTNLDARIGHWLAYPFIIQMLRGAKAEDVLQLSRRHFANTMSNYLMASSVKMIRALQENGVESHIISASADVFVKGAAECIGIPADHIHGIELRIKEGRLTEELIYPVTWNAGKREKIREIVGQIERQHAGTKVYVLAGFGDSYDTDGPFLKYIATQALPGGRPIAVFYDSKGEPAEYRGLFYQCRHTATVAGPSTD